MTDPCPDCTMMTNYLESNDINYEAIKVQKNPVTAQRLVQATGQMGASETELMDSRLMVLTQIVYKLP